MTDTSQNAPTNNVDKGRDHFTQMAKSPEPSHQKQQKMGECRTSSPLQVISLKITQMVWTSQGTLRLRVPKEKRQQHKELLLFCFEKAGKKIKRSNQRTQQINQKDQKLKTQLFCQVRLQAKIKPVTAGSSFTKHRSWIKLAIQWGKTQKRKTKKWRRRSPHYQRALALTHQQNPPHRWRQSWQKIYYQQQSFWKIPIISLRVEKSTDRPDNRNGW